jgi:N-acyl-D-amino-acid deacylase
MEGYYADLAVIDLKKMADHATYLEPHQYATGVRHLLVNGVLSIADGKATEDRGGKALRRE